MLIVALLAFWGALRWAGPIIADALSGEDGVIVSRAAEEADDPNGVEARLDEPLDGDEIAALQEALLDIGYEPGPIDGILGALTRDAIAQAKADLGLEEDSDRRLLLTLAAVLDTSTTIAPDAGTADSVDAPGATPPNTVAPATTAPATTVAPTTTLPPPSGTV